MPFIEEDLLRPLAWRIAIGDPDVRRVLKDLQANILKPHGRDHVITSILRFDTPVDAARAAARVLGQASTNALQQLQDAELFNITGKDGAPLVTVALSAAGYTALGVEVDRRPGGQAFTSGLRNRGAKLPDLGLANWEQFFLEDVHAVLLVADSDETRLTIRHQELLTQAEPGARQVAAEYGLVYRDRRSNPVEHFGFVDGRSQPLLLEEDIARERDEGGGDSRWPPGFPLATALVPCPGGVAGQSFGSFLAFLKLEQNVQGFREATHSLSTTLGIDEEYAAAMVVGRFRDGTPLAMRKAEEGFHPVWNNFSYRNDLLGTRCPLHAHIRRMNPRKTSEEPPNERSHAILRRGVTYGRRVRDARTGGFLDAPAQGVGLLFMSYQSNLVEQFEFLLANWARGLGFPGKDKTFDQLIGPAGGPDPTWNSLWGEGSGRVASFSRFVTLKGGEYFFAPSLSFLRGL
jgi:Dyp-type peroxidase family